MRRSRSTITRQNRRRMIADEQRTDDRHFVRRVVRPRYLRRPRLAARIVSVAAMSDPSSDEGAPIAPARGCLSGMAAGGLIFAAFGIAFVLLHAPQKPASAACEPRADVSSLRCEK